MDDERIATLAPLSDDVEVGLMFAPVFRFCSDTNPLSFTPERCKLRFCESFESSLLDVELDGSPDASDA